MSDTKAIEQSEILHIPGTGPSHDRNRGHFFVVIESADEEGRIILCPYCTYHDRCDKTYILKAECHEKVTCDSFMLYFQTKYYLHTHVVGQIALGNMKRYSKVDAAIFKYIRNGVIASPLTPRIFKKRLLYIDKAFSAANTPSTDETLER